MPSRERAQPRVFVQIPGSAHTPEQCLFALGYCFQNLADQRFQRRITGAAADQQQRPIARPIDELAERTLDTQQRAFSERRAADWRARSCGDARPAA